MTQVIYKEPGAIVNIISSGLIKDSLNGANDFPNELIKGVYRKDSGLVYLGFKFYIIMN